MSYRVCIPCAGTGSRLGDLTRFINKPLLSIGNRPSLSRLIEQFPPDAEFVIALGYKGNLIREFLMLAYPNRQFYFSEVSLFEGTGSGLGLSLQTCKKFLEEPFIFISCDTLVDEPIPAPLHNWMGYAEVNNLEAYRTLHLTAGFVTAIAEKGEGNAPEHKSYIGLAGIHHYQEFWLAMENGGQSAIESGEAHGMRSLLPYGIQAHNFTWHDTGCPGALAETRKRYREANEPNILEKANESIWFVSDTVIKFSSDNNFIVNRVKRSELIQGFVPEVTGSTAHMYRYSKVDGEVLSEVVTLPLFDRLLEYCISFWQRKHLPPVEKSVFQATCLQFYRDKTFKRAELFYKLFDRNDGDEHINGKPTPKLETLLNALDWYWLADGLPGRFHGDFHFENILWSQPEEKFIFLDWRQDFGGDLSTGDIYYDLAKLLHGLIVNHKIIVGNLYTVNWNTHSIDFDLCRKQILVECERYFSLWLERYCYDRRKVSVLAALIFLNISPLHHHPYSLLLYALGKSMLQSEMEG